ncbi:MAG: hypothetical protein WCW54_01385 [Candidatus Paceibacterota bacterium]
MGGRGEKRILGASQGRRLASRGGVAGFFRRKIPVTMTNKHDLPSKKIFFQKSLAFEFLNLTLQKREVSGTPLNPWAELRSARENFAKNDLGLLVESLLNKARTHFSKNQ